MEYRGRFSGNWLYYNPLWRGLIYSDKMMIRIQQYLTPSGVLCAFNENLSKISTVLTVFAGIVMTSSSGINRVRDTVMHIIWSVLAQAPSKLFPVYCVHRTITNWNLETSQSQIKTWLFLTKLCLFKNFWPTFVYITILSSPTWQSFRS